MNIDVRHFLLLRTGTDIPNFLEFQNVEGFPGSSESDGHDRRVDNVKRYYLEEIRTKCNIIITGNCWVQSMRFDNLLLISCW